MSESIAPDLDLLMERIRAELTGGGNRREQAQEPPAVMTLVSPGLHRYRFGEFAGLDNESFVRSAYLAVLGREPAEMDRLVTLHRLEAGQTGRALLLRELLSSDEGRLHGSTVTGLPLRAALERLRHNRASRMLRVVARLARNSPQIADYMRRLAAQSATAEHLALRALASADAAKHMVETTTATRRSEVEAWAASHTVERTSALERMLTAQRQQATAQLNELARTQAELQRRMSEQWRGLVDQKLRLELLLNDVRRRLPEQLDAQQLTRLVDEEHHLLDALCLTLADRYRGSRNDIKQHQAGYVPEIERAAAATGRGVVIDLGCGRGEWLELLRDQGLTAFGYDANRLMVEESRSHGLDARQGEALEGLTSLPNDSASAITGLNFVEHLSFADVVRLLDLALRVLRPGGLLLLETANPGNLLVATEQFHLDPTHRSLFPAELLAFVAEARGFTCVETRFSDSTAPAETEELRQRLNAPVEYCILGWKA